MVKKGVVNNKLESKDNAGWAELHLTPPLQGVKQVNNSWAML